MGMNQIKVELIDSAGGDISVVNSARVSFDKTSKYERINFETEEECDEWFANGGQGYYDSEDCVLSERWMGGYPVDVLSDKDKKLVNYLADHKHLTTFRHNFVQIRCHAPIFLARQLGKHQTGLTWSEVSRRYVDSEPEFYIPDEWRGRPDGSIKQGSSELTDMETCNRADDRYLRAIERTLDCYEGLLRDGVAPEMARMILPQSMMTTWWWTGNLLAFAHVYKERISEGAQLEAQHFAKELDAVIRPLFPVAWQALVGGVK
jgi:thymidylate synthase (FAD)